MSTRAHKNEKTFRLLEPEWGGQKALACVLGLNDIAQTSIAKKLGISRQAVSKALYRFAGQNLVKREVVRVLGFNPWE